MQAVKISFQHLMENVFINQKLFPAGLSDGGGVLPDGCMNGPDKGMVTFKTNLFSTKFFFMKF